MMARSPNRLVVIRGAGEMASGVIMRLFHSGFNLIALEKAEPVCVRRTVCFGEAVYEGEVTIEQVRAVRVDGVVPALEMIARREVPIIIDPCAESIKALRPAVLVDGRMLKRENDTNKEMASIVIGLGPGFEAGQNCHAVVETNRGVDLGRVIYQGSAQAHTGQPSEVEGYSVERVQRAPCNGEFFSRCRIGDEVSKGEEVGQVDGRPVLSQLHGLLRGLIRDGLSVRAGQKIGDVDPRMDRDCLSKVSDKGLAIGNGVLEAVKTLTVP